MRTVRSLSLARFLSLGVQHATRLCVRLSPRARRASRARPLRTTRRRPLLSARLFSSRGRSPSPRPRLSSRSSLASPLARLSPLLSLLVRPLRIALPAAVRLLSSPPRLRSPRLSSRLVPTTLIKRIL